MRYTGRISDDKDLITKEYADTADATKIDKVTGTSIEDKLPSLTSDGGLQVTDLDSNLLVQTDGSTLSGSTIPQPEIITNKVTSLSSTSTDTQYPSAKCVYDIADYGTMTSEEVTDLNTRLSIS